MKHCCDDKSCDLAMVLSRKCFTVHCYSLADCQTIPDGHAQIAYVSREGLDGVGKLRIILILVYRNLFYPIVLQLSLLFKLRHFSDELFIFFTVPSKPTKAPSLKNHPSNSPYITQAPRRPTPTFSPTMTRSDPNLVLHLSFDKIEENRIVDDSKFGNDASLTTGKL